MRRKTQLTAKDWDVIATALAFISSGDLDECEYDAEDFDAALYKVNERRKVPDDNSTKETDL